MSERLAIVTGAPGWLGTRLVETLLNGLPDVERLKAPLFDRVRVLSRSGTDASRLRSFGRVEVFEGDLRDPASLARLVGDAAGATAFHAAGVIHPTRGVRELFEVNHLGTQALLAACENAQVRRFVHVSSNSPLGVNASDSDVFDEASPYHPYMAYGRSKMLAELEVRAAADRGRVETVIVRPPWFYGPNQPARQSLFFTMIRTGKAPIVGSGKNRRSMAYIDNICQGLLLSACVPAAAGNTYWIADERPYEMNEIVATIEETMEKDFSVAVAHNRMRLPGLADDVAWLIDKAVQGLGAYHQKIHVLSEMGRTIACTVEKAKNELGYAPTVALREGMRRSLQWMRENGQTW